MIREVQLEDAQAICNIYNYYVENTVITFEEDLVPVSEMEHKIQKTKNTHPWLVYEEGGKILAYAYGSPWRVKSAYRFSAELTIYSDVDRKKKGVGLELYSELLKQLGAMGVHAVYGVITVPNEKSNRLHEKLGFIKCGHFTEVGFKFNKWIDVGYWEKILTV